jgi:hypothetical protein
MITVEELDKKLSEEYTKWLANEPNIKNKFAIDSKSKYERFYICGEDLEDAFLAGYLVRSLEVENLLETVVKKL